MGLRLAVSEVPFLPPHSGPFCPQEETSYQLLMPPLPWHLGSF